MSMQTGSYSRARREAKLRRRQSQLTSAAVLGIVSACVLIAGVATIPLFVTRNPTERGTMQSVTAEGFGKIITVEAGGCRRGIFNNSNGRFENNAAIPCRELDASTDGVHVPGSRIEKIRNGFLNGPR
jgi:hypothetical protein